MEIALFDLDNTLLGGDSDCLWGEFLIENGIVDKSQHTCEDKRFYQQYMNGTLDIQAFLAFQLKPLAEHDYAQLLQWRKAYIAHKIKPIILDKAQCLLDKHRKKGRELLIITATNRFITQPIAALFGIDNEHLLATEAEFVNGQYTGAPIGIPCFQEGKIKRFNAWVSERKNRYTSCWFYSDSRNDIPLLSTVDHAVAVDPDETLASHAKAQGWPVISLR